MDLLRPIRSFFPQKQELVKAFFFEYGGLMRNGSAEPSRQHCRFLNVEPISKEVYTDQKFLLFHTENNADPVALDATFQNHRVRDPLVPRRVRGELYVGYVPPELLDQYRRNGVVFRRKEVRLIYPGTEHIGKRGGAVLEHETAWMYVGAKNYWYDPVSFSQDYYRRNPELRSIRPLPNFHHQQDLIGDYHFCDK